MSDDSTKNTKVKLLDFWAPWCGPCKLMNPILDELEKEFVDQVDIEKINIDENMALGQKYSVMSIPTYILIKDGEEAARKVGFTSKSDMVDLLKS